VDEAGVQHVGMVRQGTACLIQMTLRAIEQILCGIELVPMHRADRVTARSDRTPARREALLAGRGFGVQLCA
jgi:hypothetical protein